MFNYNKLWKLMIDKKINKTKLREIAGITSNSMTKMTKNESVQLEVLVKVCKILECQISDIVDIEY